MHIALLHFDPPFSPPSRANVSVAITRRLERTRKSSDPAPVRAIASVIVGLGQLGVLIR